MKARIGNSLSLSPSTKMVSITDCCSSETARRLGNWNATVTSAVDEEKFHDELKLTLSKIEMIMQNLTALTIIVLYSDGCVATDYSYAGLMRW